MLEEVAVVQSISEKSVELSTRVKTTCNSCEHQSHCGTGLISRYLAPKPENLVLCTELHVEVGQRVKIGVSEKAMLKLAFFIYLMPIFCLMFSASALTLWVSDIHEGLVVILSLVTTLVYFEVFRLAIKRMGWQKLEPKIIEVLNENAEIPVQNIG